MLQNIIAARWNLIFMACLEPHLFYQSMDLKFIIHFRKLSSQIKKKMWSGEKVG